jgi:hypothetical protein
VSGEESFANKGVKESRWRRTQNGRYKTPDKRKLEKERKRQRKRRQYTKSEQTLNPRDRAEKSKIEKL